MKKLLCLTLVLCMVCCSSAYGAVRPEGSFRMGAGGKTHPTSPPLVLSDDRLITAVSTPGGIGDMPLQLDGEPKTCITCMDGDQVILWQTFQEDYTVLHGLDENGDIEAFRRYTVGDEKYSQFCVFSADTGELLSEKQAIKLVKYDAEDTVHRYSHVLPDYLLVEEIHDAGATTEPRYFQLQSPDGSVLWKKNQQECYIQLIESMMQMEDGILLSGMSGKMENGVYGLPVLVKLSFAGEVLWHYFAPAVEHGSILNCFLMEDGGMIALGWGRTQEPSGDEAMQLIAAALDSTTGAVKWERLHPETETHMQTGADGASSPEGIAFVNWRMDESAFNCVIMDWQGNITRAWSVPSPGITRYTSMASFFWRGELWEQAIARNGDRWDAHYPRMEAE